MAYIKLEYTSKILSKMLFHKFNSAQHCALVNINSAVNRIIRTMHQNHLIKNKKPSLYLYSVNISIK